MAITATKPTATTFFASRSSASKTQIQALIDAIHANASRESILSALTGLTGGMSAADREQLTSMVYSQLAAR